MRAALIGVLVVVGLGCESEAPSQEDLLIGGWWLDRPGDYVCIATLAFDGEGRYEAHNACELESGAFGSQYEAGDYDVAGDQLTLRPRRSSCPEKNTGPETAGFQVTDELLRVILRAGVLAFDRVEPSNAMSPEGGGVLKFGCWDGITLVNGDVVDL